MQLWDKMGADLDPQNEQEIADLDDEDDDEEHPDFYHIDPDEIEDNPRDETRSRPVFKAIALPSKAAQVKNHRNFQYLITGLSPLNILFR